MRSIEPFHAIAISRMAHKLATEGRSILHMEFGQPSAGAPTSAISAAHRALDSGPMGYWESPALRTRIARYYADWHGVDIDPDNVILTCGASPALVLALLTAFDAGARVAFARPGYVAYRNSLKSLHMSPVEISCGERQRFQLSTEALVEAGPGIDGVIIASPANPTGTIIAPDELAAIAAHCRANDITMLSDEIYHGLSYGEPAHSILRYEADAFVINSFSKYFCMPGWRLGWLVAPAASVGAARARIGNLFLSPPSLSQHAALAAFDDDCELRGHIEVYRRNRELLLSALLELGFGMIAPPDGAFYVYVSVAHLTDDSLTFCKRLLLDTGLAIAPGIDFDPIEGSRYVRISFAVSTLDVIDAIGRLRAWLKTVE